MKKIIFLIAILNLNFLIAKGEGFLNFAITSEGNKISENQTIPTIFDTEKTDRKTVSSIGFGYKHDLTQELFLGVGVDFRLGSYTKTQKTTFDTFTIKFSKIFNPYFIMAFEFDNNTRLFGKVGISFAEFKYNEKLEYKSDVGQSSISYIVENSYISNLKGYFASIGLSHSINQNQDFYIEVSNRDMKGKYINTSLMEEKITLNTTQISLGFKYYF